MKIISARELEQALRRDDAPRVVNVLPEEQYLARHIPGSVNVPLERNSFLQRMEHVAGGKDATVVLYCADSDCNASRAAAERLEEAGFEDVVELAGGVEEWSRAGYPLEGRALHPPAGR